MSPLDSLSEDEVRQIAALVETLDRSSFDFLQVNVGNLRVTIGKGAPPPQAVPAAAPPAPAPAPAPVAGPQPAPAPQPAAAAAPARAREEGTAEAVAGTVAVVAPMMGMFYAQPSPGAPPFVKVGDRVAADATVGLIEVMKLFTPVVAGVDGTVAEVCVQDSQLVGYEQVLFRIRPAGAQAREEESSVA